jgi:hypothetical protein
MNNSRSIIRSWVARSEKPSNKYNNSLRRAVEDFGVVAADYRDGSDTGMEKGIKQNYEDNKY